MIIAPQNTKILSLLLSPISEKYEIFVVYMTSRGVKPGVSLELIVHWKPSGQRFIFLGDKFAIQISSKRLPKPWSKIVLQKGVAPGEETCDRIAVWAVWSACI